VLACLVALCVLGPALSRWPYAQIHLDARNLPPGAAHWFGTDALGRDLFARTWVGGRISLGVGAFAAAVDLGVGAVLGTVAGLAGGAGDAVLMRAVDVLYGVPFLLVAILLLAVFGPGLPAIVLAIALVNWLGMARLVRGQVLQLRGRPHLVAARALGLPPARLAARHVLPAVAGPALAWLSFNVPSAIFLEAFLSYLGLGVQPPVPSWGSMIAGGAQAFPLHPYPFVFPAAALCATMAALYALGDALRDRFDPRSAGRP
jgi:oligopeptide transport system permease protein